MPGLKGSNVIKLLKSMIASKDLNSIKLFSITSFDNEDFKKDLMATGCEGFIHKPVNLKDMEIFFDTFVS